MIDYIILISDNLKAKNIITQLINFNIPKDNIYLLFDSDKSHTREYKQLINFTSIQNITHIYFHSLNYDFATHRNFIIDKCISTMLFFIDDDELLTFELHNFILNNEELIQEYDCLAIPRYNKTIFDTTREVYFKYITLILDENDVANWPDYQYRILKNNPSIRYIGKIHEIPNGIIGIGFIPALYSYAIQHEKTSSEQLKRYEYYKDIIR